MIDELYFLYLYSCFILVVAVVLKYTSGGEESPFYRGGTGLFSLSPIIQLRSFSVTDPFLPLLIKCLNYVTLRLMKFFPFFLTSLFSSIELL